MRGKKIRENERKKVQEWVIIPWKKLWCKFGSTFRILVDGLYPSEGEVTPPPPPPGWRREHPFLKNFSSTITLLLTATTSLFYQMNLINHYLTSKLPSYIHQHFSLSPIIPLYLVGIDLAKPGQAKLFVPCSLQPSKNLPSLWNVNENRISNVVQPSPG